jgi:hypothetical protein
MAELVMELAGVSREVAEAALATHTEVWLAVDALLTKPVVSGEKYIPAPPTIDTGLSPEQEALCKRGRWLQDQVNAVYSVAHSKTLSPPDAPPPAAQTVPVLQDERAASPVEIPSAPQPDAPSRSPQ